MGKTMYVSTHQVQYIRDTLVKKMLLDVVQEHLNKRQSIDSVTRNFLRFLTSVCGIIEVRRISLSKLEMWIVNAKLGKLAQELMMSIALNCVVDTSNPIQLNLHNDILANFLKLRFKNKSHVN